MRMFRSLLLRRIFAFSTFCFLLAGAWQILNAPTRLTVAVGPEKSPLTAYLREISSALSATRDNFRLRIVTTKGSGESSALLDQGKVDLAIVRSDDETSQMARALVILQRKTIFVIAHAEPSMGLMEMIANRAGAYLAKEGVSDHAVIVEAFAHYGRTREGQNLKPMDNKQALEAFRKNLITYLVVVAHPSELETRSLVAASRRILGSSFRLLALPGAKGLAYQLKHLETASLPSGVFGGDPSLPAGDLLSVAVTHEFVATARMGERTAAQLTKALTDLRTQLRGTDEGEFSIELPSTDEPRRYLPHAGTVTQINGDTKSFMDTYSDMIWLVIFAFGLVGSALSTLASWLGFSRKDDIT